MSQLHHTDLNVVYRNEYKTKSKCHTPQAFFLSKTLSINTHLDKWEAIQDLCKAMNQSEV